MVKPSSVAVTPALTFSTRVCQPPSRITPEPLIVTSLSMTSWLWIGIVVTPGAKVMVSAPELVAAWISASRSESTPSFALTTSLAVVTVKVAACARPAPSSAAVSAVARPRRDALAVRPRWPAGAAMDRMDETSHMVRSPGSTASTAAGGPAAGASTGGLR